MAWLLPPRSQSKDFNLSRTMTMKKLQFFVLSVSWYLERSKRCSSYWHTSTLKFTVLKHYLFQSSCKVFKQQFLREDDFFKILEFHQSITKAKRNLFRHRHWIIFLSTQDFSFKFQHFSTYLGPFSLLCGIVTISN